MNMPDYKAMYHHLFNTITDVIVILKKTQQETEEMYIEAPEPDLRVLGPGENLTDEE
jgi:hypothetical protein